MREGREKRCDGQDWSKKDIGRRDGRYNEGLVGQEEKVRPCNGSRREWAVSLPAPWAHFNAIDKLLPSRACKGN